MFSNISAFLNGVKWLNFDVLCMTLDDFLNSFHKCSLLIVGMKLYYGDYEIVHHREAVYYSDSRIGSIAIPVFAQIQTYFPL